MTVSLVRIVIPLVSGLQKSSHLEKKNRKKTNAHRMVPGNMSRRCSEKQSPVHAHTCIGGVTMGILGTKGPQRFTYVTCPFRLGK